MPNLPSNLIDDAVIAVGKGVNVGLEAFKDGFQFPDLFQFIPTAMSIQVLVENKEELIAQVKDYSLIERAASIEKLKEALNLSEGTEELVGIIYDIAFGFVRGVVYMANRQA